MDVRSAADDIFFWGPTYVPIFTISLLFPFRYQMFRYPEDGNDRIRAQSLGQFVFVKGKGEVINPKKFLKEDCAYDKDLIDSLVRPNPEDSVEDILVSIENLDSALRNAAAKDDSQRMIKK